MSDELGKRGESLFYVTITRFYGRELPLFRPQFLGDKWPTLDFFVELMGAGDTTPYFFAQVRATRRGRSKNGRLRVAVHRDEMRRLALYPAPTFVVGIDEISEEAYILSANGESTNSLASLPTDFPINETNQALLWEEVKEFWTRTKVRHVSKFVDPKWSVTNAKVRGVVS